MPYRHPVARLRVYGFNATETGRYTGLGYTGALQY